MIRRLMTAVLPRALGEALGLGLALTAMLAGSLMLEPALGARTLAQGTLLISGLAALWGALRREPPKGRWPRQVMGEIGFSAALGATFAATCGGLIWLLGLPATANGDVLQAARSEPALAAAFILNGPLALGFRIFFRGWLGWDDLRRRHLVWSLTHAIMMAALAVALVSIVVAALPLVRGQQFTPPPDAGPLGQAVDTIVFSLFPIGSILIVLAGGGLLLITPPVALFSYVVARRITRRLHPLADAAAALREGQYTARSPVEGADEVAQLQADFNAMADALEKAIASLEMERDTVARLLEARRKLVGNVSHDLRTPAATIRATLESARSRAEDALPDDLAHDLDTALAEIERQGRLIDDLFLLSQAEVGRLTLRAEPVDVARLACEAVEAARPLAWASGRVDVVAKNGGDLPLANADPARVAQILHNLLHNALRHTPPGGIIAVETAREGDLVALRVRDTGEGIPAEALPHVWERFYRVSDDRGGSGLGLSIVRELTAMMGGSASVESVEGQGSTFTVWLPRHHPPV
jgi:signal transduction histidine kinase